ncbi:MAG: VOC family protein [Candidatus Uhrbacteria bacterium]|nr:VOC family protein [Candidatus Uhrbacteria bacterium]
MSNSSHHKIDILIILCEDADTFVLFEGGSMFATIEAFYEGALPLTEAFNRSSIQPLEPLVRADHICYKCGSHEEFEHLRRLFETASPYLFQSTISDRLIAIIKLPQPILTVFGKIWFLELSDQKPDGSQMSGFDHIEIYPLLRTIKGNPLTGTENLLGCLKICSVRFEKVVRPHHTTCDIQIENGFRIRIEEEPLIDKIKREEMK